MKSKVTRLVEKNDKIVRAITLLRDRETCRICGRTPGKDGVILHYHHAVKTKGSSFQLRFDSRNCITLCAGCHFKVHNDSSLVWVDHWRAIFRQLIPIPIEEDLIIKHNTGTLKRNIGSMQDLKPELENELQHLKDTAISYAYS